MLFGGILQEFTRAEQYWALGEEIARNAQTTNQSRVAGLIGNLQLLYAAQITLALSKIFEPVNKKYQIRSIPVALKFIEDHANDLKIIRRDFLSRKLHEYGMDKTLLASWTDEQITKEVHRYFLAKLPSVKNSDDLSKALFALKISRDKSIVHHEAIDASTLPRTSFKNVYELICYVREFLEVVGSGYTGLNYSSDSDWFNISQSKKLASDLKWLLVRANIAKEQ